METASGDRSLIRDGKEETASATTAEIPGTKKKEEEALDVIRAGKKRKAEGDSCCDLIGKEEEESVLEATAEIIRAKKKEVMDLFQERARMYEARKRNMYEESKSAGGTTAGTEIEEKNGTTQEEKERKKKKVVKWMFPQAAIDLMMARKPAIEVLPDDVLATYPKDRRDIYDIRIAIKNKILEYEKAVIDQYMELGYAVHEREVTDDENETVEN